MMRCLRIAAVVALFLAGPRLSGSAFAQSAGGTALPNGIEASSGGVRIRVQALTDSILRVRVAPNGRWSEDASWAVPAAIRLERVGVGATADGFTTAALAVHLDRATLRVTVSDLQGRTILADSPQSVRFEGSRFTLRKALPLGEHIYGLGDKTGNFDRRGESFVDWNTDAWGFQRDTDPIYKSIPFYIASGGPGGAYGLFLDNTWRSWFDFGHRDDGTIEIGVDGGPVDYYVIAGPGVRDVVRRYTDLTGRAPLPPLWSLGFQQSRYSYVSADEVRTIAARLRSDRVPADVIWLDIDYQDRNRPFTTNPKTFPDLKGLARDVGGQGFKLVAITDLHVAYAPNQGYAPYDSGAAGDHFLKNPDGSLYVAPVWPGPSVFPDFTRASSRAWWGSLYKDFVADGIAGFWNDMNEPAIFDTPTKTMPLGTVHRIEGDGFASRTARHAEVHNLYGMENSRATFEGLRTLRPNLRPFVMTRASYAGGQRYAVTWTGDNSSTWDHLKLAVQQMLSLGLSGFSWSGADIPGFVGGASPELMTRWFEIGAFTPVFRAHAANDAPRAEPWVDGPQHLAIRRRLIEERYRLLPYLYAVAEESARTGDPVMRPTFYDYPAMASAPCDQSMAFTLGRDLLVAASPKPEQPRAYDICLPGKGWYDYWTGLPVEAEKVSETPKLDRLPVFVRPGAILPRQPLVQSTAETPKGPLELDVYPGGDCRGELYLDDGVSVNGPNLRQAIMCRVTPGGVTISFGARGGSYRPWWKQIAVTVHGAKAKHLIIADQPRAATIAIP
ncbi:MAG: alpha-glucosidase [Sphingomonadales bacterium]|nr:alpha-glucosidase [Sphingomonadales bacterium]